MPDFGQCSEPLCTGVDVRLFDCAHHCMKLVCLQHLIEHDRLIENNQDYLNCLRTELKQLWLTYSSLVDETKIRLEYEQKLKKHQQLIKDLSNLFENNSMNIQPHRLMLEKLKQYIEQEKQTNQNSMELFPHVELVKNEPIEEISINDGTDSVDISLAARIEKLNKDVKEEKRQTIADNSYIINENSQEIPNTYEHGNQETINNQTIIDSSIRRLAGECPFWFDGAYGLTADDHGMFLCHRRPYRELYRHLIQFHKLSIPTVEKVCQSIQNKEDPVKEIIFQSDDIVMDQINQFHCPFSIYSDQSSTINRSCERPCRSQKPKLLPSLRYHFVRDHQMSGSKAKRLVYNLKTNSQNI